LDNKVFDAEGKLG